MHATSLITPGVMVAMAIGFVIFIVVYRLIFRKPRP